jgi:hypothetical protein
MRGHGRARTVQFRIRLNEPASVRARLVRRGRRAATATRSWDLPAGLSLLKLRVPRKAATGRYRVDITVRDTYGQVRNFAPQVRLGR